MDEDAYSIEEEFQVKECDRTEHLKHIRQLEEQRNAQEQKEIELERVQRQIINKLNITEKSDNEIKSSDNAKAQSVDKSSSKQNGIHNSSKTDVDKPFKTVQKNNDRRRMNPNKFASSFHSDGISSHNHNPHYKENSYRRHGFHDMRQQRSYRGSRGRSSNHQRYQERYNRPVNNSIQEFDHTGKQQVDLAKEEANEYLEYDLPPELFPNTIQEEEEMLKEAIELSKQQMFIEKLERREIDKAIEETLGNQQTEPSDEGIKTQRHSNSRKVSKEDNDASRKLYSNSNHSISSDSRHGDNYNREKTNYSRTDFAGNSRPVKYNKTKKLWLKGKQNDTTYGGDSSYIPGTKIMNPFQMPKRSPDMSKQNPNSQTETTVPRTNLTTEALVESCSNQIAEYDINSSKWKECARKDLKQLLHLDNSSDSSVKTDHVEIAATLVETGGVNSNTIGAEANNRHGILVNESPCRENYHAEKFNGKHRTKNNCNNNHTGNCVVPITISDCSQDHGSSHKMGSRVRISERRTTRVQHKGKPNNSSTNDSESVCANWIPYRKLAEEGRTESIPPRFRKQCQQLNS